jgi:hypothetical protein
MTDMESVSKASYAENTRNDDQRDASDDRHDGNSGDNEEGDIKRQKVTISQARLVDFIVKNVGSTWPVARRSFRNECKSRPLTRKGTKPTMPRTPRVRCQRS